MSGGRRLVVEADGGSRGNPGPAAYGALVRDPESGDVLSEEAAYLGHTTNNVAEYSGLLAALRLARAVDPDAFVEARMDSKLVVEQMSGRWKIKHEDMRRLALQARALIPREQVRYVWVPRAQNGAADRLANEAMDLAARGLEWQPRRPAYAGYAQDDDATHATDATHDTDQQPSTGTDPQMDEHTGTEPTTGRLAYRLLTGSDDQAFCERVSQALADGYQLHGGPALTHDGTGVVVAQAVIDKRQLGYGS